MLIAAQFEAMMNETGYVPPLSRSEGLGPLIVAGHRMFLLKLQRRKEEAEGVAAAERVGKDRV
ncbi:MAG: hypothetical protein VW008_00015 [Aquiluna sp.]